MCDPARVCYANSVACLHDDGYRLYGSGCIS